MSASRVPVAATHPRLARTSLVLTFRDLEILRQIHDYCGCAVHHVHARWWPAGSRLSTCYRRIALLTGAGYLSVQRLPSVTGTGSGKAFLTIGPAGRPILARLLGVSLSDVPRRADAFGSAFYPAHHLRICDVRCAFELAAERIEDITISTFLPEVELRKRPIRIPDVSTVDGRERQYTITIVPDGAFRLTHAGQIRRLLLEVDLGTIVPARLSLRLRGYLRLQSPDSSTLLLFMTTTPQRADQVLAIIQRQARALQVDPTSLFVTTLEQISADTALTSPIWQHAGALSPIALIVQPGDDGRHEHP